MVEDRITDGTRIAQLLASELTGLQTGPLADTEVVDSDPDAIPSDSGTVGYRVRYDGEEVGTVLLYPSYIELELRGVASLEATPHSDVTVGDDISDGVTRIGTETLQITYGAAVKQAVDVFCDAVEK